jgi:hypothetical protein
MSTHDKTLKLVTNLDRAAIEAKLGELRRGAQSSNLTEVAGVLAGIEGLSRADMEQRVRRALKWLAGKPEHKSLTAQLELVEINLPNLK